MSEPRQIAVVTAADGYAGILRAFRDRQAQLGLSAEKMDEITMGEDSENRYSSKWLSGIKALGAKSWGDALGSTGMMIVFVEDVAQMAKLQKHLQSRNNSQVRTMPRIRVTKWLFTPRSARRNGKKRWKDVPKADRSRAARHAINIRWKRERARRKLARMAAEAEMQNISAVE
jgi:hypothetical protein